MEGCLFAYLLTTLTVSIVTTEGSLCYSCTNVPLPHVCDTIRQCGPHESCYVERFVSENGVTYFESGCKANLTCGHIDRKKSLFPDCTECCNTDYCNKRLCSDAMQRSVNRCLKCSGVFNPTDCTHVTICSGDELCHTQETVQFGYTLFSLGCLPKATCKFEPVFGRRNILVKKNEKCHQCCQGENCNRNLCPNAINTNKPSTRVPSTTAQTKPSTRVPSTTTQTTTSTEKPTTTPKRSFRDCLELYNQNIRTNGIYRISPDNQTYFDVYCDMDGGGWTLIMRRVNASMTFRRGWNEYVNGFGDLSGNFWLGLEHIRLLTQQHVEIMFEGITKDTNETVTMRYNNFYIDGSADNYTMHVNVTGVYNTVAQQRHYERNNGFGFHDGAPFSTFDRPNDKCSQYAGGGGWWYNSCWVILPTGPGPRDQYMNLQASSYRNGDVTSIIIRIKA